ncbi:LPS translocon maturation chaperone LptM [Xenorhabdus siamensis]|uniref:LPS translocon maturation chaperone LptM n=1 Tax=Xenorhabdus siamensis TaxID=3136254 RepID=UPI003BF57F21
MMNKQFRWSLAIITLLSIAGCGLKGPLYFPPAESVAPQTSLNKAQPTGSISQNNISKNDIIKNNTSANA